MCFVQYCTQNELIIYYIPVYPYKAVIRLNYTVSIQLTAVNYTAINLQVWGLDGMGVLPIQPYRTNCIVRLRCTALMLPKALRFWGLSPNDSPLGLATRPVFDGWTGAVDGDGYPN